MSQEQERFIHLVKEITTLQWVRESLPSHSKYYEGLKKKLEKQQHLKEFSKNELKKYHAGNNGSARSFNQVTESVVFYENAVVQLQTQMEQAKIMMEELNLEKKKLDGFCNELHLLYDELIFPDTENASYIFEQHLRKDVEKLTKDIPILKNKIDEYKKAQSKLYQARELVEIAMKSLPGASKFMDRQALAVKSNAFDKIIIGIGLTDKSDELAKESYKLVNEANLLCPKDVPNIPHETNKITDIVTILTNYRGYRLKIEAILRTKLNPRLNSLENQMNIAKYNFEQKTIDWIDHQILLLESHLRTNGCLLNQNIDREISILRMGSRAAIAAVAEETTGRVAVDDALDISTIDTFPLPQYQNNDLNIRLNQVFLSPIIQCDLPSYANHHLPPPAYTR